MTAPDPIRAALKQWQDLHREDLLCPDNPPETDWVAVRSAICETEAALKLEEGDKASPLPTPTPSLDELLTPDSGFEHCKPTDPGAQFFDFHWWTPRYGSESLSTLLDDIRARILPYLRPPVVGIDLPGPDGDYAEIADLCRAEGVPIEAGARLLRRAKAAWNSSRIPLTPLFYESEDGYCIFVDDRKEHDWQVSRYTKDGLYTPERLFANGEWSKDWHADNTSEYTFPTATAAWEALKKWQEGNHA